MSAPIYYYYNPACILLDVDGLPTRHERAIQACVEDFQAWVNELPDTVYHLSRTDAEEVLRQAIGRYLLEVRGSRR